MVSQASLVSMVSTASMSPSSTAAAKRPARCRSVGESGRTIGWTAARTLGLLAASAALLAGFLVIEARAEAPLLPLRLFRLKTLAGSNAVGFLLGASFFGFIFIGTLYMQQVLGYSAVKTGFAWLAASLISVALAGVSQMLVTRTSVRLVMAAGMVLVGAGILWATKVPVHGQFWADL